jgi:DNA-directed RNA polymerase subunit beta'
VIVGRLIPAGTGSVMNKLRAIAAGRDQRNLRQDAAAARIEGSSQAAE